MIRGFWLIAPLMLAGCAAIPFGPGVPRQAPPPQTRAPYVVAPSEPAPAPPQTFRTPQVMHGQGLEGIIQQSGPQLISRFGQPRLDVHEGDMRKLQFAGRPCVLDIFLYPLTPGGEPVATYVDARRASDGQAVDRAACIRALGR